MKRRTTLNEQIPEQDGYLLELARIFAQGVLRLHQQGHLPLGPNGLSPETALETARQNLEQSALSRLSVTRG